LQYNIRTVNRDDLPSLEWNGEYRHYRILYQDIFQSSQRGEAIMWIAEIPGASVIGQLFVQLVSARSELADGASRAYIYAFRVQEPYRDQGIGSRMLQVAEESLAKRGFCWVSLNVGKDNTAARRLYSRQGYSVVSEEPGRWSYLDEYGIRHEVNEPAWRMEKRLDCTVKY
jgi:ribosomal protein S18 acetylase RimI-like enzyme